jgi:hypothetical protein
MDSSDEADLPAWIEEGEAAEAAEEEARKRARTEVEFPPFVLSFDTYLSSLFPHSLFYFHCCRQMFRKSLI